MTLTEGGGRVIETHFRKVMQKIEWPFVEMKIAFRQSDFIAQSHSPGQPAATRQSDRRRSDCAQHIHPLSSPYSFWISPASGLHRSGGPFRSFRSEEKENESRVTSETFLRLPLLLLVLLPLHACCLPVLLPPLLTRSLARQNVVTCLLPHFGAITALPLLLLLAPFPGDAVAWPARPPGAAQISGIA